MNLHVQMLNLEKRVEELTNEVAALKVQIAALISKQPAQQPQARKTG